MARSTARNKTMNADATPSRPYLVSAVAEFFGGDHDVLGPDCRKRSRAVFCAVLFFWGDFFLLIRLYPALGAQHM